ncbi:MAG: LytTR family transcriptional regulator DNA-binding domain-containing protein [Bacteroidales bacterium]|nr:LytTR family transcriptional regulator DNA-binding domain-containing protein [Bacteroidales bacterium]
MKRMLSISFWLAAILLVAAVMTSLRYGFAESVFIGTLFLPGALAVKYFYPKVSFSDRASGIKNTTFITIGIILAEMMLFMIAHFVLQVMRDDSWNFYGWPDLPDLLSNPAFIAIMISALAVGDYFFEKWLEKRYPSEKKPVTFLSERKSISLMADEIFFVESSDTVTTVVATEDRHYRNKTPISQWEAILGDGFIRIHRSYLVNNTHIESFDKDSVLVGGYELPVSRKYLKAVSQR